MTPATFEARTAYGIRIVGSFATTRAAAFLWAADHAHRFPNCRLVRLSERGPVTIWRHVPEPEAEAA